MITASKIRACGANNKAQIMTKIAKITAKFKAQK